MPRPFARGILHRWDFTRLCQALCQEPIHLKSMNPASCRPDASPLPLPGKRLPTCADRMTRPQNTGYAYCAALVSHELYRLQQALFAYAKAGFNPSQPRIPRGLPNGGQWVGYNGHPPYGYEANPYYEPTGATEPPSAESIIAAGTFAISIAFGPPAVARWLIAQSLRRTAWKLGSHKSNLKWKNRIEKRKWTADQITNTLKTGKRTKATNKVNKGNRAIMYTNPKTGKFLVRDEVTKEILQISDDNFIPPK